MSTLQLHPYHHAGGIVHHELGGSAGITARQPPGQVDHDTSVLDWKGALDRHQ